jgi:hypothetical protein
MPDTHTENAIADAKPWTTVEKTVPGGTVNIQYPDDSGYRMVH